MNLCAKYHTQHSTGKCPAWGQSAKHVCANSYVGRAGEDRFIKMDFGCMQLYGVFDGHGGSKVVNAVVEKLPQHLYAALQKIDLQNHFQFVQCVQDVYRKLDMEILQFIGDDQSGSTATVAVVLADFIYLINLGDSRTVLFNDNRNIILETKDHSPDTFDECKRIESLGGRVVYSNGYRINGTLAVSRAFGDYDLKRTSKSPDYNPMGWVSIIPDIYVYEIPKNCKSLHLLLASDGLWDAFNSKDAIGMFDGSECICNRLIAEAKTKTTDDITVIVVKL